MAVGIDFITTSVSTGTTSQTVASNQRTIMMVIVRATSLSTPGVTYNGNNFTWETPYFNGSIYSPWVGYLVNPTVGTHNLVNITGENISLSCFYDVDQSSPMTLLQSAGRATSVSPLQINDTTSHDGSLVIKTVEFDASGGFTNGGSEVSLYSVSQNVGSYLATGTAGAYSTLTTWPVGTYSMVFQTFELNWGGALTGTVSATMGNASSRLATNTNASVLTRALSDSIGVGAGRLVSQGIANLRSLTVSMGNAVSRLAIVTDVIRVGWHLATRAVDSFSLLTRSTDSFTDQSKTTSPILATAGQIMGALAMTYSGGDILATSGTTTAWTDLNKS